MMQRLQPEEAILANLMLPFLPTLVTTVSPPKMAKITIRILRASEPMAQCQSLGQSYTMDPTRLVIIHRIAHRPD